MRNKTSISDLAVASFLDKVEYLAGKYGKRVIKISRWELFEQEGKDALKNMGRRVPNIKNRTEPCIEERVVACAIENPAFGQTRVSNELKKEGVCISPCGVRCEYCGAREHHEFQLYLAIEDIDHTKTKYTNLIKKPNCQIKS